MATSTSSMRARDTGDRVALHPHFGLEIRNVDLSGPLSEETFAGIHEAFLTHSVLVFREQALSDEQQVAFSERFGMLECTSFSVLSDNPYVYKLANTDGAGNVLPPDDAKRTALVVNARWHTDSSFRSVPAMASILSAREVPSTERGNTEFASMRVAYETLPEARRVALAGLKAVHSYAHTLSHFENHGITKEELDALPPVVHPLVRTDHPSGKKNLYVSGHIERVVGMPDAAGLALKSELIDWCTRAEYVYSHHWRKNDLVVWDNRCALHRATHIPAREPRIMHRTTVAGHAVSMS